MTNIKDASTNSIPTPPPETYKLASAGLRTAGIAFAIWMMAVPASGQPKDPYAESYNAHLLENYLKDRSRVMKEIELFYFALGCKVFVQEGQFLEYTSDRLRSLAFETSGVLDLKIGPMAKNAASSGMQRANRGNECSYWTEHPDAVYRVRRTAEIYRQ